MATLVPTIATVSDKFVALRTIYMRLKKKLISKINVYVANYILCISICVTILCSCLLVFINVYRIKRNINDQNVYFALGIN